MNRTFSNSPHIPQAITLLESLQSQFVANLEKVAEAHGEQRKFSPVEWLRDAGRHGGGIRFEGPAGEVFNSGSVNFSHVHYDDEPSRQLQSATALSTIVHPTNPFAPSIHIHLSWTELKSKHGYWRVMADLNPSILNDAFKERFHRLLMQHGGNHLQEALADGERYFFIPALGRHRGVMHFYLEEYQGDDFAAELQFCQNLVGSVIDLYPNFISEAMASHANWSAANAQEQLAYHTLYFLQVLTLDRGTTAGLMVHNQNDLGTLGSLPTAIDRSLLETWVTRHSAPQVHLLNELIAVLPPTKVVEVTPPIKLRLVEVIRKFYTNNPGALNLQASGSKTPKTVANHDQ